MAIGLLVAGFLAQSDRALASCGPAPRYNKAIHQAPAVFVGEVVQLSNARRWATVDVTEGWKGGLQPGDRVEVRAGPKDPGPALDSVTTVDRYYRAGRTYLFVPYRRHGSVFRDNACTRTTLYRPELQRFRPAGFAVASPTPSVTQETDPKRTPTGRGMSDFQWLVAGPFAVVLGGLVVFLLVRRRAKG